ncbi:SDR family NAD(P)-dependent oxidoreductase [Mastigocoleus testarum]|uniref:Short-chain dehydrogenase n=1 Tax=Mastigocoleus testarum BC008 TaxID=371196 RepID=A0A0V7ZWP2_9CYAN|nr:SDR family NAD(P)-dependent oxidoreductase [Mastigocoleus testarum]KST68969.1 short-chain dehydrogenase [Mastigocoleus testarum BC008]
MNQPVCMITGVGDGTGAAIARRFAQSNYQVAMVARNQNRLKKLESELPNTKAHICDVGDLRGLLATIKIVRSQMGNPSVLIHNAVRATFGNFLEAEPEDLERNFRVNTTSLLYLARELAPAMIAAGKGTIVVTGNTAAWRGIPSYTLFAPTKAAQRILTQSLARDLGPKGVHVAYITIDAAIATPWSMGLPVQGLRTEPLDRNPKQSQDFFCQPVDIAEEIFHVVHQAQSAWSFDVEIRPFGEKW